MSGGVLNDDAIGNEEGQRTPSKLKQGVSDVWLQAVPLLTAVTASMHKRNVSDVKYRESDREYSFHSWDHKD